MGFTATMIYGAGLAAASLFPPLDGYSVTARREPLWDLHRPNATYIVQKRLHNNQPPIQSGFRR